MNPSFRCMYTVSTLGFALLLGCSERGPKTVPVYGTVSFPGREVPKTVRMLFRPSQTQGPVRPTIVKCEADGSYEAKSFERSRGLLPGTYNVEVLYYDLKPGSDPNIETNWEQKKFAAGEVVVDPDSGGVEHNIEVPLAAEGGKKT